MAAGGKKVSNGVAVAMAVALLALLVAVGEAGKCNVDQGVVMSQCMSACTGGDGGGATPSQGCCAALANADFGCLCRNYWSKLKNTPYASCAMAIPSQCGIQGAPRKVRFQTTGESSPVSPAPCKFIATARAGLRRLHVTPSQLQKLALPFQEASDPVPELPSPTCASKASSAAPSRVAAIAVAITRSATSEDFKLMIAITMPILFLGLLIVA